MESPGLELTARHHYSGYCLSISSTLELLVPHKINLSVATTWGSICLIPFNNWDLSEKVICLLPQYTIDLLWDYLTLSLGKLFWFKRPNILLGFVAETFFCLCAGGEQCCWSCHGSHHQALMGLPHSCFHFQEVDIFQRADKEPGCGWKFPLLHHWPKWKQSAHSRPTLWFPLPIPQTCQVWGSHRSPIIRTSAPWCRTIFLLLLCEKMYQCCWHVTAGFFSFFKMFFCDGKVEAWEAPAPGYHTLLQTVTAVWIQIGLAIWTNYSQHTNFWLAN